MSDEQKKAVAPERDGLSQNSKHNTENFLKNKNKDKYEKYTKLS